MNIAEAELVSDRYLLTLNLVARLFKDRSRKDKAATPYIVHLVSVAQTLSKVTDDEDVILAGLLHDVIEKIPSSIYSEQNMLEDYGERITDIVRTVSFDENIYGKDRAREIYLDQIREGSEEACLVSAADLLHNSKTIIMAYKEDPEWVVKVFGGKKAMRRKWYWGGRLEILRDRLGDDNPIVRQLNVEYQKLEKIHQGIIV